MLRALYADLPLDDGLQAETAAAAPIIALTHDTGNSATDRVTNDASLTVTGLVAGNTPQYSFDNGVTWLAASPANLADSAYTVLVRQIDDAGLPAGGPVSITFTLDRGAPAALTVTLTPDTFFSGGSTTFEQPYAITGQEADAVIEFTTDGGAHWLAALPGDLVDGLYTIGVRQTDVAGNISEVTEFSLDLHKDSCTPCSDWASDGASHNGLF